MPLLAWPSATNAARSVAQRPEDADSNQNLSVESMHSP
eukprot:CAMPEP_0114325792 /NCGR_PEP_ID=MMETSP0059-20121206/29329_1 /TAXON_ID=36894 /ORGANISM="Pyramimonas parkeae, Strain CCMP726" /LENGTH=37 /DNA_ID= /DNA_START= /DNA_END= /DNA_ORIENTATION=